MAGLTATAQAQPVSRIAAGGGSVPQGVATGVALPACSKGQTPTVTSSPALPATITLVVNGNKSKLVGVWPAPPPSSYKITVKCSGGTTKTATVTVLAAPPENSAVGLGAQTQQSLVDQFSGDYNASLPSTATHLYNWDAINPVTGALGDTITVKQNCASFARPNGSSAGITQLARFATTSDHSNIYCDNFANSSRPRGSSDPPDAPGGVTFVALAGDAVGWAKPAVNTLAPASLSPTQLTQIWSCTVPQANSGTGMNQWGDLNPALTGSAATTPIAPFLPQSGSGTLSFWLTAIGVSAPGPCVSNAGNTLEENEGVNPVFSNPGTIWIYSVGDWIAQKFHSPSCSNSSCTGTPPCKPTKGKNEFGCNVHGTMTLGEISGVAPTTGSGSGTKINPAFPTTFDRILFEVVPYDPNTTDHIPGSESGATGGVDLENIFGSTGWACTSATAKLDIQNYGFESIPTCGTTS